jgi:hypothetical protein
VSDRTIFTATQSLLSALHGIPALLYFDSFFLAPSVDIATSQCNIDFARRTLFSDAHICPQYYYASIAHDQATVPAGVPVVSYRFGVWPFMNKPPPIWSMRRSGNHQPEEIHVVMAHFLFEALLVRAGRYFGCHEFQKAPPGHLRLFMAEEHEHGLCPTQHAYIYSPLSKGAGNPGLEEGAISNEGIIGSSWKFYEDSPGKPGWIFEGSAVPMYPVLSFFVPVFDLKPKYNIGYLKSYGCMGKVLVWVGDVDPSQLSRKDLSEKCSVIIDGNWKNKESMFQVAAFSPPSECIIGTENRGKQGLWSSMHFRPLSQSDLHVEGCQGIVNKFKLEYIESCSL